MAAHAARLHRVVKCTPSMLDDRRRAAVLYARRWRCLSRDGTTFVMGSLFGDWLTLRSPSDSERRAARAAKLDGEVEKEAGPSRSVPASHSTSLPPNQLVAKRSGVKASRDCLADFAGNSRLPHTQLHVFPRVSFQRLMTTGTCPRYCPQVRHPE